MRNREDVRKQNGGVERKSIDGLQSDFARDLGIGAHLEKAAGPLPRRAVFRQIAARLAHQPNRPARRRFPQQGAQQQIVLEGRRVMPVSGSFSRIEQSAMLENGVAIGHSRNVVRHRARASRRALAPIPAASRCALCSSGIRVGSLKNASNSSRTTRRALAVMRRTL